MNQPHSQALSGHTLPQPAAPRGQHRGAALARIFHGFRQLEGVAQASSLRYHGFPIRRCSKAGAACRLEVGDTAGWKPALHSFGSPVPLLGCDISGLGLAAMLYLAQLNRAAGQDHVDYRFESYQEDHGRVGVQTHSWLFEKTATSWLTLRGQVVYDAISGSTPVGAPPPSQIKSPFSLPGPLSGSVPTKFMEDKRWAGEMDATLSYGPHHLTPQFSYSSERDYLSYGAALNYSLDLNEKNTSLNLGWAHDWDTILANRGTYIFGEQHKDTDNLLIGANQLLGPNTVLTLNFTFRNSSGYLSDPYRGVVFDGYPQTAANHPTLFPEKRPDYLEGYIAYASLLQYIKALHGSAEGSYRFYADSFGIFAHTLGIAWHQKIGSRLLVSPLFRYYEQSAADFYATQFAGDPSNPYNPARIPTAYSADYRLSHLETVTYGVEVSARVLSWLSLNLGFKRYEMMGLDGVTSPSAYPHASIVTVGSRLWF